MSKIYGGESSRKDELTKLSAGLKHLDPSVELSKMSGEGLMSSSKMFTDQDIGVNSPHPDIPPEEEFKTAYGLSHPFWSTVPGQKWVSQRKCAPVNKYEEEFVKGMIFSHEAHLDSEEVKRQAEYKHRSGLMENYYPLISRFAEIIKSIDHNLERNTLTLQKNIEIIEGLNKMNSAAFSHQEVLIGRGNTIHTYYWEECDLTFSVDKTGIILASIKKGSHTPEPIIGLIKKFSLLTNKVQERILGHNRSFFKELVENIPPSLHRPPQTMEEKRIVTDIIKLAESQPKYSGTLKPAFYRLPE